MSELHGKLLLELLRSRLSANVRKDLAGETDESLALRKALLTLIMLTQDGAGSVAKEFIEYLVTDFPAVADHFSATHDHPLFTKHTVGRRRSDKEGVVLSLEKTLVDSILKRPVTSREMAQVGGLVQWDTTAERYVGFYDIMGFRAFVARYGGDHSVLHKIMQDLYDIAVHAEEMHPHPGRKLHPAVGCRGSQVRIIQFSDSIMALTRDASATSSLLIQLVSQMFFLHALRLGTALRGAIARGTITADFERSIFFGQPIVDAYLLEENQAWYGIAEHSSTQPEENAAAANAGTPPLEKAHIPLTVLHKVPLKSSGASEMAVINWPVFCEDYERLDELILHLRNEHSEKLGEYYHSTREFARAMLREFLL
jgi:hypothetical protein